LFGSFVGELFMFFNNLIKYRAYIILHIKIAGILSHQSYIKTNMHKYPSSFLESSTGRLY